MKKFGALIFGLVVLVACAKAQTYSGEVQVDDQQITGYFLQKCRKVISVFYLQSKSRPLQGEIYLILA